MDKLTAFQYTKLYLCPSDFRVDQLCITQKIVTKQDAFPFPKPPAIEVDLFRPYQGVAIQHLQVDLVVFIRYNELSFFVDDPIMVVVYMLWFFCFRDNGEARACKGRSTAVSCRDNKFHLFIDIAVFPVFIGMGG